MQLKQQIIPILVIFVSMLLGTYTASADTQTLEEEDDFQALSQEMRANNMPLLLAFHADHCHYCQRLITEHLAPMERSGDYQDRIFIRTLQIDSAATVRDFDGSKIDADQFTARYQAYLTPTLLFLDAEGKEVTERMLGYNSPDFYAAYLEEAIVAAKQAVQAQ